MSKWIAEFELEDGDIMPEHMDLEYYGVKLDFHCRPIGETYEDGLNEAWEVARKIACEYDCGKLSDIFGTCSVSYVIERFTASEAIEKIEKYEKTKAEIKVGDEVENIRTSDRGIVVHICSYSNQIDVMWKDGSTGMRLSIEKYKKTGRHFPQIEEVLQQMQEGKE